MFNQKKLDLDGASRFDFIINDVLELARDYLGAKLEASDALALAATLDQFGAGFIAAVDGAFYWYDDTVEALADAVKYIDDPKHAGQVIAYHITSTGTDSATWYEGQVYLLTRTAWL